MVVVVFLNLPKCVRNRLNGCVFMCFRMGDHINVVVHHKDKFKRDEHDTLEYVNGEYCIWEGVDKH